MAPSNLQKHFALSDLLPSGPHETRSFSGQDMFRLSGYVIVALLDKVHVAGGVQSGCQKFPRSPLDKNHSICHQVIVRLYMNVGHPVTYHSSGDLWLSSPVLFKFHDRIVAFPAQQVFTGAPK